MLIKNAKWGVYVEEDISICIYLHSERVFCYSNLFEYLLTYIHVWFWSFFINLVINFIAHFQHSNMFSSIIPHTVWWTIQFYSVLYTCSFQLGNQSVNSFKLSSACMVKFDSHELLLFNSNHVIYMLLCNNLLRSKLLSMCMVIILHGEAVGFHGLLLNPV